MSARPGMEALMRGGQAVVRVALRDVRGSSPREEGAEMFVAPKALCGTIGGGRLEFIAIEAAREMLEAGDLSRRLDVPLGPEIGQCCGGHVRLALTRMRGSERRAAIADARAEAESRAHVYILGAGHVGRALARQMQHLPFATIIVDGREAELAQVDADVETRLSAIPEVEIAAAPPGSAFVVLTHDHALDFLLAAAALERGDAAYAGLIGSATKRVKFDRWFAAHCSAGNPDDLICPIGAGGSRDKRPPIIAAQVAAEVTAALTRQTGQARSEGAPSALTAGSRHGIPDRAARAPRPGLAI